MVKDLVTLIRYLIVAGIVIILGMYIQVEVPEESVGLTVILIGILVLLGIFVKRGRQS